MVCKLIIVLGIYLLLLLGFLQLWNLENFCQFVWNEWKAHYKKSGLLMLHLCGLSHIQRG